MTASTTLTIAVTLLLLGSDLFDNVSVESMSMPMFYNLAVCSVIIDRAVAITGFWARLRVWRVSTM